MPLTIEATHQKWIKATEEWTQETLKGANVTYFDRNFSIDDMTWRRLGNLKFNVKLKTSLIWHYPLKMKMDPIVIIETDSFAESKEILNDFKLGLEYSVEGKSGSLTYNPRIESLHKFESKKEDDEFSGTFYDSKKSKVNVTFKLTFELELKKTEIPSKPKLLHKLYSEGEFSDVKIHCDGQVFDCHKIILSGQSGVFKKMLVENDMVEATSGKVEINDTSATTMKNLLFYIYHEDLYENEANIVLDLLMAAEKYAIFDLVKICVKVLKESLSEENVVAVMTAAFLTNQEELFESAYKFIFKLRIENQNVEIEGWKELDEKNPTLVNKMMRKAMFKM